ncbi:GNAT family [Colletotrichum kahawae]|uniref:GNAT family n=1 Tax=Colletotrichum kahawae TaxID=34407 RepID=A0AAD9Y4L0_COLKA|nr:GNAT family [Colletotrichum kahawae]
MSAFWTDPNWMLLWPRHITLDFLVEQAAKRLPNNLLRGRDALRHEVAVDPATGALVGYARWELPAAKTTSGPDGSRRPEWAAAQIPDVSAEERKALKDEGGRGVASTMRASRVKERILAEKPYLSLDYLAVHPENKGKGIATALVESGMRQAEKIGIDVFILAFQAGLGLYLRLGFKEVERVVQDDSKWGGKGEYTVYLLTYEVTKSSS